MGGATKKRVKRDTHAPESRRDDIVTTENIEIQRVIRRLSDENSYAYLGTRSTIGVEPLN